MDQPVSGKPIRQPDSLEAKLDAMAAMLAALDVRQKNTEDFYMELVTFLQASFEGVTTRGEELRGALTGRLDMLQQSWTAFMETQRAMPAAGSQPAPAGTALRRKRLFVSTGYFATAVAATIAAQQSKDYDDYLLITIDRQGAEQNTRWAHQMNDGWESVRTIGHTDYYENNAGLVNPFGCDFDDVYAAHFLTYNLLRQTFPARRYFFYEEGLTSYAEAFSVRDPGNATRFYALSPNVMRSTALTTLPVDIGRLSQLIERSTNCYQVPLFESRRNIVLLATGLPTHFTGSRSLSFDACEPAARALRAAGFDVWLRPHPRVPIADLFDESGLAACGVRLLESDVPLIEPLLLRNRDRISAVVSVYSSLLIHSYPLFGIPAFSIAAAMHDKQQAGWKALQDAIVPDVQRLLQAAPDGIAAAAMAFHNALGNAGAGEQGACR